VVYGGKARLVSQYLRKAWLASCENVLGAVAEERASILPMELRALAGSEGRASVLAKVAVLTGRLSVRGGGLAERCGWRNGV